MSRVLLLVKRFPKSSQDSWLTNDLATELMRRGHHVTVLVFDASGEWKEGERLTLDHGVAIGFSIRASRGGLAPRLARLAAANHRARVLLLSMAPFDLVINFSIAAFFSGVTAHLKRRGHARRSMVIIWDFFPIHHLEIGRIRLAGPARILRAVEAKEVNAHDWAGLMSPEGVRFFHQYHPSFRGKSLVVPLWGPPATTAPRRDRDEELRVVFGGQLTRGRGVEQLIRIAIARQQTLADEKIRLLLVGKGEYTGPVTGAIERHGLTQLELRGHLPRPAYVSLLNKCDVGLVATVAGVSVPTFPSKCIDYWRSALPIVASTEASTDFGDIIETEARCGLAVPAGNDDSLVAALMRMAALKRRGELEIVGRRGLEYFERHHSVGAVAADLERIVLG